MFSLIAETRRLFDSHLLQFSADKEQVGKIATEADIQTGALSQCQQGLDCLLKIVRFCGFIDNQFGRQLVHTSFDPFCNLIQLFLSIYFLKRVHNSHN